ncbi:MAG: hypothetical protein ACE5MH_07065 [Terriglobia bacterium]
MLRRVAQFPPHPARYFPPQVRDVAPPRPTTQPRPKKVAELVVEEPLAQPALPEESPVQHHHVLGHVADRLRGAVAREAQTAAGPARTGGAGIEKNTAADANDGFGRHHLQARQTQGECWIERSNPGAH